MNALYLVVGLAGQRVALPAADVESVVEVDSITPVPRVAPHIAGLFALRSRVLTVIDSQAALGIGRTDLAAGMVAVIVLVEGHPYALLVDEVHDVLPAPITGAVPAILTGGWAAATIGVIEQEGQALLLLDPAQLVGGPMAAAA